MTRKLWILTAVVLVVVPVAVDLARAGSFRSSAVLVAHPVPPYASDSNHLSLLRGLLKDRRLRALTRVNSRLDAPDFDRVTLRAAPRRMIRLTATAGTPSDAQRLASTLATQLEVQTQLFLAGLVPEDRARTKAELRTHIPWPRRRQLRRRLRLLEALGPLPPPLVLPGPAELPRAHRWGDRLAYALTPTDPARPHPVLAAMTGLLLAVLLWLIGGGPSRRRSPSRRRRRRDPGGATPRTRARAPSARPK